MPRSMRLALAIALVLPHAALAAPVKPPPTWADWVGDYRGRFAWSNCTTGGARLGTLSMDAIDGTMTIDLTRAGRELRRFPLVAEDDGRWSARDGDVAIAVTRPTRLATRIHVTYDSGCTMRASLTRAAPGPDCGRLLGWMRIAASCTKRAAIELPPTKQWGPTDGPTCRTHAARIELVLIDAGCAPHPDGDLATRSADCRTLAARTDALARCGTVPPALRDRHVGDARAIVSASRTADRTTIPVVERQCRDAAATLAAIAKQHRCP